MILSKGEPIEEPENDHGELNINETEPLATSRDISTISSISDLGFVIEAMWQVAISEAWARQSKEDAILHVVRQYALRPHLAILWDGATENEVDESDDEDHGSSLFNSTAFCKDYTDNSPKMSVTTRTVEIRASLRILCQLISSALSQQQQP
ncbi:hypothetical protein V1520DRAFT_357469 [Lipomyces starkeyi]